ncbi:MAG: ABC transporter ATP-binding protein [Provencibacterium sp.]|jgi:oligopeptide transport system ATP-binding protein|nr:ABC transporter ATP-binding protein [Provencibacterium sp.]
MPDILTIEDLHVSFDTYAGEVHAVRGVSLTVGEGEVLAIVGESGCGKSVTAQTIMKLNPMPPARIKQGKIELCGVDIVHANEKKMQEVRGGLVSMIFQDPMTSLNPTMRVGKQITEAIQNHRGLSNAEAAAEALRLLEMVRIPNAAERAKEYPHQFSGGMRQRVMIAMALSCQPKLLIADEPTTALDVTIQAQIMQLMAELRRETGTAIILITHDLGVVANLADRVAVMYAGKVVEMGDARSIFYRPNHPYTEALLKSLPTIDTERDAELVSIAGTPPDLFAPPPGCAFASRCEKCMRVCKQHQPPIYQVGDGHISACWRQHPSFVENEGKAGKEAR